MKIAYSCAGEGLGHAARMVCLAPYLEKDFEVLYFIPRSVRTYVEGRLPGRTFRALPWFSFEKKGDKVLFLRTFFKSVRQSFGFLSEVLKLKKELLTQKIEAVVDDFDPYLSWAARLAGLRVIQLNHPGIVQTHMTFDPRSWFAAAVTFLLEGFWNKRIHCSFYCGQVGPLIRPELLQRSRSRKGPWLLHLKPEYRTRVLSAMEKAGLGPFEVFPKKDGDFDAAMARCRGVISSAGHQIISEALVLGKPILVIPQKGQFEQELNARKLKKTRLGMRTSFERLERDLAKFRVWAEKFSTLGTVFHDDTAYAAQIIREALWKKKHLEVLTPVLPLSKVSGAV